MDKKESQLCKDNILYFSRKLKTLNLIKSEWCDLELSNRQRLSLLGMDNSENYLLYVGRQYGKTLLSYIYAIHQAYFHNKTVIFMSCKNTTCIEAQAFVKKMCVYSGISFNSDHKLHMGFGEGHILFMCPPNIRTIWKSPDVVIFDEFAFMDKKEEWCPSIFPVLLSRKSKIVFTGTGFKEYAANYYNFITKWNNIKIDKVGWEEYISFDKYKEFKTICGDDIMKSEFPSKYTI